MRFEHGISPLPEAFDSFPILYHWGHKTSWNYLTKRFNLTSQKLSDMFPLELIMICPADWNYPPLQLSNITKKKYHILLIFGTPHLFFSPFENTRLHFWGPSQAPHSSSTHSSNGFSISNPSASLRSTSSRCHCALFGEAGWNPM